MSNNFGLRSRFSKEHKKKRVKTCWLLIIVLISFSFHTTVSQHGLSSQLQREGSTYFSFQELDSFLKTSNVGFQYHRGWVGRGFNCPTPIPAPPLFPPPPCILKIILNICFPTFRLMLTHRSTDQCNSGRTDKASYKDTSLRLKRHQEIMICTFCV